MEGSRSHRALPLHQVAAIPVSVGEVVTQDSDMSSMEYSLAAQIHFMGTHFRAAVAALHSADAAACRDANAWLVSFSIDPAAPSVAEQFLQTDAASAAEQTFAAGILARAARQHGLAAVDHLLRLCHPPSCTQAASSLAVAVASTAVAAWHEEALLRSQALIALPPRRRLLLLQALADALRQSTTVEQLRYARPSGAAACRIAVGMLQDALLGTSAQRAVSETSALQCVVAWGSCGGLSYAALHDNYPSLAVALYSSLDPATLVTTQQHSHPDGKARHATVTLPDPKCVSRASLAAAGLQAFLQSAVTAGEEVTLPACAPLLHALSLWVPHCHGGAEAGTVRGALSIATLGAAAGGWGTDGCGGGQLSDQCASKW